MLVLYSIKHYFSPYFILFNLLFLALTSYTCSATCSWPYLLLVLPPVKVLRLYFKHIHVLLLFLVFPGKLPLCSQSSSIVDRGTSTFFIFDGFFYGFLTTLILDGFLTT